MFGFVLWGKAAGHSESGWKPTDDRSRADQNWAGIFNMFSLTGMVMFLALGWSIIDKDGIKTMTGKDKDKNWKNE